MKHPVYVGTSGWNYESFVGTLYPLKGPKRKYLEIYCTFFDTVELNATFYRTFPEKTFKGWYSRTPDHFKWSVKMSRYITHIQRLAATDESLDLFWSRVKILKEKLACVLVQLPPSLRFDLETVEAFLKKNPQIAPVALEARHESWHSEKVWELLKECNTAWVVSHTAGRYPMSKVVTADFAYVRLHGTKGLYRGMYGEEELKKWLELFMGWERPVFVYFDNTDDGSAAKDALLMKRLIEQMA